MLRVFCSSQILSNTQFISWPICMMSSRMNVGMMPGMVTCRICFQRFAPSMRAAS